ncbi:hypothetical protein QCA50_013522 [Cerrena zonata]|uniref:CCHC-type domain-containing protein n=1 Tax=Cerrena zonata TaxID=2478898 RepID=A0AAW0G2H2_9APHY
MTSRYNFRSRANSAPHSPPVVDQGIPGAFSTPANTTTRTELSASVLTTLTTPGSPSASPRVTASEVKPGLSYSQVTASRSPSPSAGEGPVADIESNSDGSREQVEEKLHVRFKGDLTPSDDGNGVWTPVSHKRHNHSPVGYTPIPKKGTSAVKGGQNADLEGGSSSVFDATSAQRKGKMVDPTNWGAVNISAKELDTVAQQKELNKYAPPLEEDKNIFVLPDTDPDFNVEEQCKAFEAWKRARIEKDPSAPSTSKMEHSVPEVPSEPKGNLHPADRKGIDSISTAQKEKKIKKRKKSADKAVFIVAEALASNGPSLGSVKKSKHESETKGTPAGQISTNGYLGVALKKSRKKSDRRQTSSSESESSESQDSGTGGSSESDPSDSEPSDSEPSNMSDSASSDGESGHDSRRKKKNGKPYLKPEKPDKYSGELDAKVYTKWVHSTKIFLLAHRIPNGTLSSAVACFLDGRAYDFYTNTLVRKPKWGLNRIFIELFNYCFPMDYQLRMHEDLQSFEQGRLNVRDYAHELESLLSMVGPTKKKQRVLRLWQGLNKSIQRELWKARLSPLRSSWRRVLRNAEYIEASRRVGESLGGPHSSAKSGGNQRNPTGFKRSHPPSHGNNLRPSRMHENSRQISGRQKADFKGGRRHMQSGKQQGPSRPAQLSEKEKDELRAANKCFICKEPGHFSRNCPQASVMRSNRRGKPPGVPAYSMEPDFSRVEALQELADSTVHLDEIILNSISLEDNDDNDEISEDGHAWRSDGEDSWDFVYRDLPSGHSRSGSMTTRTVIDLRSLSHSSPDRATSSHICPHEIVRVPDDFWDDMPALQSVSETDDEDSDDSTKSTSEEDPSRGNDRLDNYRNDHDSDTGGEPLPIPDDNEPSLDNDTGNDLSAESTDSWGGTQHLSAWDKASVQRPSRFSKTKEKKSNFGVAIEYHAAHLLQDSGPYTKSPLISGDSDLITGSFVVYRCDEYQYIITHEELDEGIFCPAEYLKDPHFDLPVWFQSVLDERYLIEFNPAVPTLIRASNAWRVAYLLNRYGSSITMPDRFLCQELDDGSVRVQDTYLAILVTIPSTYVNCPYYDVVDDYSLMACFAADEMEGESLFHIDELDGELISLFSLPVDHYRGDLPQKQRISLISYMAPRLIELNAIAGPSNKPEPIAAVQRNAAMPRDFRRLLPEPIVIVVQVNGHPA